VRYDDQRDRGYQHFVRPVCSHRAASTPQQRHLYLEEKSRSVLKTTIYVERANDRSNDEYPAKGCIQVATFLPVARVTRIQDNASGNGNHPNKGKQRKICDQKREYLRDCTNQDELGSSTGVTNLLDKLPIFG
jgi:hypothetical protein